MKPIISESVYKKLYQLLQKIRTPEGKQLGAELSKANVVKDEELHKNVVTINSEVEFLEEDLNKPIKLKIVMPEEADLSQRKISIFAPISIALIGFKESYTFNWMLPSGEKKLKIIRVIN
jgi:regulator of nucleoside diphosphate kinase